MKVVKTKKPIFISRDIDKKLIEVSKEFPIVVITGPRQSGKTTLVKQIFNDYNYVNLEILTNRELAQQDPANFLETHKPPLIIDEVQLAPNLFHELQAIVDQHKQNPEYKGQYILTGSNNLLIHNKVTQSLAGRAYILSLLPFSIHEILQLSNPPTHITELILQGFYPSIYSANINPVNFYNAYIETYLQKDVRDILHINKLLLFLKFIRLVAYRISTILDYTEIATNLGVSVNTIKEWFSVLYATYLVYLLPPYNKNFGKRLIKSPKLYMLDTGIASYLTGISVVQDIQAYPLYSYVFENLVVLDLVKQFRNLGLNPDMYMYYFRDKTGHEIDIIIEYGGQIIPIEVKSAVTFHHNFVKNLEYFNKISHTNGGFVIYAGKTLKFRNYSVLNWKDIKELVKRIVKGKCKSS